MTNSTRRLGGWILAHSYTASMVLLFVVLAVSFLTRHDSEWEAVYDRAAEVMRQGQDLYQPQISYAYPPFMAWAALPFSAVPRPVGRLAWLAVNLLSFLALLRCGWSAAGGGRLQGRTPAAPREHGAAVLGLLCGLPYLFNCLNHQQTDVVIGALLMGGCLLLRRDRSLPAAVCFGLAAAMKCTALLWAPYLLWRRRGPAAVCLVVVALGVNFLPDLVSRPPVQRTWLGEYWAHSLECMGSADRYPGIWGSDLIYNQSVAGGAGRWLLTRPSWTSDTFTTVTLPKPVVGAATARAGVYAAALILVLVTLWAAGRPMRRLDAKAPGEVGQHGLEYAAVLLLTLLLSPMSSPAHFGVLVLPGFCLGRAAAARRDWRAWAVLAAGVGLALPANKSLVGDRIYSLALWHGSVMIQTLLLLLACCALLWQGRQAVHVAEATPPLRRVA